PVGLGAGIERKVLQPLQEPFDAGLLEGGRRDEAPERGVDPLDIGLAGERAAGHADDAALRRQLPVAMAVVEARQDLAHGEVAGSPRRDRSERLSGDALSANAPER